MTAWVLGLAALPAAGQPENAAVAAAEPASQAAPVRRPGRARAAGAQPYVYKGTVGGDNLWDIAGAVVGPAGNAEPIDRNQVMVAIFRANPQAFPEGNLHRIQKGLDLTVPSRAEIRREDRAEAVALVAQHRKAYADRRLHPAPLYALAGGAAASAAGARAAASAAAPASAAASAAPAAEGVPSWWLFAGLVVVAGVGAVGLRAWSQRPASFDTLSLEPVPDADPADLDAQALAEQDRRRADAAAAALYSEDLVETPAEPGSEGEPSEPARAAGLAQALADAYQEVDRPRDAQAWRGRSL